MDRDHSARHNLAFGSWLAAELRSRNLNQSEFAARLGVSQSTVSRWLNGRLPEAKLIDPISDVLVIDYDLVATRAGYRPPMGDLELESRKANAISLVNAVDWESDPTRLPMLENFLRLWIEQDRKLDAESAEGE